MQEEIESRILTLIVSSSKFIDRTLKETVGKYLAHCKAVKLNKARDGPIRHKGKQTVKQLVEQGQGVSNIELQDKSSKEFERIARKYGVDYAVKQEKGAEPPKFLIFFKARDADALTAAFKEYTQVKIRKQERRERPSVLEKLAAFKDLVKKPVVGKEKQKEIVR